MSVTKTRELQSAYSAAACYEALCRIASGLGWEVLDRDRGKYNIIWRAWPDGWLRAETRIAVSLRQLPSGGTLIGLVGHLPGSGWVDGPRNIPRAWKRLLEPFEGVAAEVSAAMNLDSHE